MPIGLTADFVATTSLIVLKHDLYSRESLYKVYSVLIDVKHPVNETETNLKKIIGKGKNHTKTRFS